MARIVLINCFFGPFPWYFDFFIKSCEFNPTVNFLIFSNTQWKNKLPDNVNIIPFSLQNFNELATQQLGFKVEVKKAYKLCDFKPAYGEIFKKYIKDYEFWGMCDIDLIFGRIREFITKGLLKEYEVISVRNDYPTGSFMIFRNNQKTNNLFRKSKDYKKVLKSERHYCFDECNFKHGYLQHGGDIFSIDCEIESMHHVIKREEQKNNLKAHFDFMIIEGLPGQLRWNNGILTFKNKFEILMYHLILFKSNSYTLKKYHKPISNDFSIHKYQISYTEKNPISRNLEKLVHCTIKPRFKMFCFKMDAIISQKLSIPLRGLKYQKIHFSEKYVEIGKDSGQLNNWIAFNGRASNQLVKSLFYQRNFYIKNFSRVRYSMDLTTQQLSQIHFKGDLQKFN